jgi:hypothetical protein
MSYREARILEEILLNLKPHNCLEWGAGHSSLYFPKFLSATARWQSVEHNNDWALKVQALNRDPRLSIYYVPSNKQPWNDQYGDGGYSDFKDYIEFPSRLGKFDFILIDGRARRHCLAKAFDLIANSGVVALHDANRSYYREPLGLFKYAVLLDAGEHAVWLGSKGLRIELAIDLTKHLTYASYIRRFLLLYDRLPRTLRFLVAKYVLWAL